MGLELTTNRHLAVGYETVTDITKMWEIVARYSGKDYAFDIETTGLSFIADNTIGFAVYYEGTPTAYYFVFKHSTADDVNSVKEFVPTSQWIPLVQSILGQNRVAAAHNAKFDLKFLRKETVEFNGKLFDTLLAAQLLDENRKNGLKSLAPLVDVEHSSYQSLAEYKSWSKDHPFATPINNFGVYAAKDVETTWKLRELFGKQLASEVWKGKSLQSVFHDIWMPLSLVLQEMEEWGMKLDIEACKTAHAEVMAAEQELATSINRLGLETISKLDYQNLPQYYHEKVPKEDWDKIYKTHDDQNVIDVDGIQVPCWKPLNPKGEVSKTAHWRRLSFNVGSSKQLAEFLYVHNKIEIPKDADLAYSEVTNLPKADFNNLQTLVYYLSDGVPQHLLDILRWRKLSKWRSTYLETFINDTDEDGRLHCLFNQAATESGSGGTVSGRLSSSAPNLQNIPSRGEIGKEARNFFISGEGNVLVVGDYSNMETVLMASYSGDIELVRAFNEGLDVHAITACAQHNIPYDKFMEEYKAKNPHYDAMRRVAKTVLFGTAYGMGARKLRVLLLTQNDQDISEQECKRLLAKFNDTYFGLTEWKKEVNRIVAKRGYVYTIYGRKRRLDGIWSDNPKVRSYALRQGVNSIIQGSCGDIIQEAMLSVQSVAKSFGGSLVAQVHDELVVEVPARYAEAMARSMEHLMVDVINTNPIIKVPFTVEAHYATTWGGAK